MVHEDLKDQPATGRLVDCKNYCQKTLRFERILRGSARCFHGNIITTRNHLCPLGTLMTTGHRRHLLYHASPLNSKIFPNHPSAQLDMATLLVSLRSLSGSVQIAIFIKQAARYVAYSYDVVAASLTGLLGVLSLRHTLDGKLTDIQRVLTIFHG